MSDTNAKRYAADGYLLVRGLLDPDRDLGPVRQAYTRLIDALAYVYLGENCPEALAGYDPLPFPQRFAVAVGASGGGLLHHLDPLLNIYLDSFQWRRDLPTGQLPELFATIRNSRILDVLESLIGPEILASPIYHVNLKLAQRHLAEVERVAKVAGRDNPALEGFYNFQVGKTDWHMDAISGLRDSHASHIVNAWIPLTEASAENGCLKVIPGSHTLGVHKEPFPEGFDDGAVTIPMSPGDVLFLDNKLLHSATRNTSADDYRWAFNFRYLRAGEASGRPFLPGFVARSRSAPDSELHNPYLWSTLWDRALAHSVQQGVPCSYQDVREGKISDEEAASITARWRLLAPDTLSWLRLGRAGAAARSVVSAPTSAGNGARS
jgi:ectoine hydroxylase-related dioxygenase (phytanoyl-CoA dioxygenase family)